MKALALLVLPLLAPPAAAQSLVPGPNQAGRYEMQAIDGGVARLDTVTGDVSLCRVEDGTLRCRPSEDAGGAPGERRSDLSPEERDRSESDIPPRPEQRADADADIDKAIRRMKKLFHAFGDIAREFENERQGEGDRSPDRT